MIVNYSTKKKKHKKILRYFLEKKIFFFVPETLFPISDHKTVNCELWIGFSRMSANDIHNFILAPEPPANLSVIARSGKAAVISWSPPAKGNFSSFKLRVSFANFRIFCFSFSLQFNSEFHFIRFITIDFGSIRWICYESYDSCWG